MKEWPFTAGGEVDSRYFTEKCPWSCVLKDDSTFT